MNALYRLAARAMPVARGRRGVDRQRRPRDIDTLVAFGAVSAAIAHVVALAGRTPVAPEAVAKATRATASGATRSLAGTSRSLQAVGQRSPEAVVA